MNLLDLFWPRDDGHHVPTPQAAMSPLPTIALPPSAPADAIAENSTIFTLTGQAHSIDVGDIAIKDFGDIMHCLEEKAKIASKNAQPGIPDAWAHLQSNELYKLYNTKKELSEGRNPAASGIFRGSRWKDRLKQGNEPINTREKTHAKAVLKYMDGLIRHVGRDEKLGKLCKISLGQEAILLHFSNSKHLLRITPRGNICDELIPEQEHPFDCVINHYSICVGDGNHKEDNFVISVVPKLTAFGDPHQVIDLHLYFRDKYGASSNRTLVFSDIKTENIGALADGTPVITDLGAVRAYPSYMTAEREMRLDAEMNTALEGLGYNPSYERGKYCWTAEKIMNDGSTKTIKKQELLHGDPKQSNLGKSVAVFRSRLDAAVGKSTNDGAGWRYLVPKPVDGKSRTL